MTLREQMATDMAAIINTDVYAVSATYTEPSGQTTALTVELFHESTTSPEQDGIVTKLRTCECAWSAATLSDVNRKSTITVNSEDWSIADIVFKDDFQVVVRLERHELHEHTRPDFRRRY